MKNGTMQIFKDLQKIFKLSSIDPTKVYIAGGSLIGSDDPNDIDLYCEDFGTIEKVEEALSIISYKKSITDLASTFHVMEYKCPVQVIKILQGKPEDVVKQFDFEQNSSYLKFSDTQPFHTNGSNSLKMCEKTKTPNTMLQRLIKMLGKGYTIEAGELRGLLKVVDDHFKDTPDFWNLSKKDLGSFYEEKK